MNLKFLARKLNIFFKQKILYLSEKEIYTLFGSLISEFALLNLYLGFWKEFIIHNEKSFLIHPSLFLVDIVPMLDDKYWIDLRASSIDIQLFQKTFEKINSKKNY